ncbi:MAG: hypothetical protein ACYC23_16530 [Limisphaerales bacterium]
MKNLGDSLNSLCVIVANYKSALVKYGPPPPHVLSLEVLSVEIRSAKEGKHLLSCHTRLNGAPLAGRWGIEKPGGELDDAKDNNDSQCYRRHFAL